VPAPDDIRGLNSEQWRELCDCASRLDATLKEGGRTIDLRGYLPPPEAPHRMAVLFELIKTELEVNYRSHRNVRLEEYLQRYPELGGRDRLPAALIYEEYRFRHLFGDRPDLAVYRDRFPNQFEELRDMVHAQPVQESSPVYHTLLPPPADERRLPTPLPDKLFGTDRAPRASTRVGEDKPTTPADALPGGTVTPAGLLLSGGQGYQKLRPLGRGEFGEVWRALAPGGVEVAVKVILRTLDHEASKRELKALERIRELRHPFLLQTHQYQSEKDHLVIVMELADGSLSDRYKECKAKGLTGIAVEELVTYFIQAAEALDYLHSQHVSHRDIKPQNLLMLRGYAKVADFGLARWQDQTVDNASVVCGTPHYMAPEVWKQQISKHSDQYALASTYVEMRLGQRLFPGKNPFEIAEHHIKSEPQLDPLPAAEQAVLKRALAKEPEQRFPNCVAFANALREATTPKKPELRHRPSWLNYVLLATSAIALIGVLVASYFALTKPHEEPKPWLPAGWEGDKEAGVFTDPKTQREYYHRIVRDRGGQKVVMIAIEPKTPADPPLFYIMENKVWNDLYAAFMADPDTPDRFKTYQRLAGDGVQLFQGKWKEGAHAPGIPTESLGVGEGRGKMPVFRVTVTEAHCFAEWLGGKLPQRRQWLKAAGLGEDRRPLTPFSASPDGIAVKLGNTGPWPFTQGDRDVSVYGCRQMAGNGKEWTRTIHSEANTTEEIPLQQQTNLAPLVLVCGRSYAAASPLTFELMVQLEAVSCEASHPEIGFRVVLEP
jgi:serine/threonine protein kinase